MITIKIEDKEYKCPTSWEELRCKHYIQLSLLEEDRKKYIVELLYLQRFIEIISGVEEGTFDELDEQQLYTTYAAAIEGLDPKHYKNITASTDHFIINGVTYSFYTPERMKNLSLVERVYLETLKTSPDPYSNMLKSAAVMIRPATKITNAEGYSYWKLDKFRADEVEHRAEILGDNLNTRDMIMLNNFFVNGATISQ